MGSFDIIATSISQWRNALTSNIQNRADPFNAITCIHCMLSCLPEQFRVKPKDLEQKEPEKKEFMDDPEQLEYIKESWVYVRQLAPKAEEKITEFITSQRLGMEVE